MILNELQEQNGFSSFKKCMFSEMVGNWSLAKSSPNEYKDSTYDYPKQKKFFVYEEKQTDQNTSINEFSLNNFAFESFDISKVKQSQSFKKPEPFMGAFLQTQTQFQCFDLNIRIPSISEGLHFSRLLSSVNEDYSLDVPLRQSNLTLQNTELSQIEDVKEVSQSKSLFLNLDEWLDSDKVMQFAQWDKEEESSDNYLFEIHHPKDVQLVNKIQQKIQFPADSEQMMGDQELCSEIAKMMQGIEGELFTLDYEKLQWSYNLKSIRFQNFISDSFMKTIKEVFQLANIKSRIEAGLEFIKKQPYRRVFQEVARESREVLLITQEIILQEIDKDPSYVSCFVTILELKSQLMLIYQLLINQHPFKQEERSFMDFNHQFLNSQAVVFAQILRLSLSNDSLTNRMNELVLRLLRSVFNPITFCLNQVIFEETMQISNRDETYLKYYFDNIKDILSFLGKRISLIKQESNELYLICKIKEPICLVTNMKQLKAYEKKWSSIFNTKKRMIEQIRKKEKRKKQTEKQKKQEKKIKQIYELKMKLLKSIEEEKKIKSKIVIEGLKETERLKKQIAERQERRRLNELIEKEQEKGFLLEAQLREKRNLIKQKQQLIQEAQQLKIQIKREKQEKMQPIEENLMEQRKQEEKQLNKQVEENEKSEEKQESKAENVQQNQSQKIMIEEEQKESESENEEIANSGNSFLKQSEDFEDTQVNTNTALQICVDNIIRQQIDVTQIALGYLVYDRYQLSSIIEFLRKIFLTGNGEAISELLRMSVNFDSKINLKYFNDCVLFDYCDEPHIQCLQPQFYQMRAQQSYMSMGSRKVSIFHENLQSFIGFQFRKLPLLLQPYFSYIHLSKYMQILTFIIRIRHGTDLVSKCWKLLNEKKKQVFLNKDETQIRMMNKLYATRYIIQIFLSTLQNYLYYRVIEKEVKLLKEKLKDKQLNELSNLHLKMLDTIIRTGLVDHPYNDISKTIRSLLSKIREFKNTIDMFCQDDMPSYLQIEAQRQVDGMRADFKKQQNFLQNLFYHP